MPAPKMILVGHQRFECQQCGQCCRRWYVALSPAEIERLRGLDWGGAAGFRPPDPVTYIRGRPFLAHAATGECLYLDPATNLCRIHARFGVAAKPLSCRGYPLNIASTYFGQVGVTARMDCPAIRANSGPRLDRQRDSIAALVEEMGIVGGFSEEQTDGLNPASLGLLVSFLRERVVARQDLPTPVRALVLTTAIRRLQALGATFLNDQATLEEVLPALATGVAADVQADPPPLPLGAFDRAVFRIWLAAYLRRDEECVRRGWPTRLARPWHLTRIVFGGSSYGALGSDEHPAVALGRVPLFRSAAAPALPAAGPDPAWECLWRCLDARLEALQFFGVSYYGQPFFAGLRALPLVYPLVLAAARCHAASRAAAAPVAAEDVSYAVGAIDHSHGRSALLQRRSTRILESHFGEARYAQLLASLGAL